MSTFTNQTKNSATFSNELKSGDIIYLVSNALDIYLVGVASDQPLVTQDAYAWTNETKN